MRVPRLAVFAVGALAFGIEWLGYDGGSVGLAAADLTVGFAFVVCGVLVWAGGRPKRIALLFLVTGLAWFLGTFAGSDIGVFSAVGAAMLYAHRGPFVQLLLAYPTGRVRFRLDRVVVAFAYVDGLVVPLAQNDALTVALVGAVVVAASVGLRRRSPDRQARLLATAVAALVGGTLVVGSVSGLAGSTALSGETLLLAYEATLLAAAISLTVRLFMAQSHPGTVADLVVDLGDAPRSGTPRDALARAFGDPSLEIGYWVGDSYVDERGEPVTLSAAGSERAVTLVEREGQPVAALMHDAALAKDPALTEAVAAAARLTAANARLQAELRAQVRELAASRRRVVQAGDAQRSRLERRLNHAAELHLEAMRLALARALQAAPADVSGALYVVEHELDEAVVELHELARGIHPHTLIECGLAAALAELAATAPIEVSLAAPSERFASEVEAAAYFVCSEALANVAKYAQAAQASVGVQHEDGRLVVLIADGGIGGADPARGSGLRGLADRIEAVGGRLRVWTPPVGGTSVLAEIPLEGAP